MHPLIWFLWLIAAFVMVSITRNPLYLSLLFVELQVLLHQPAPHAEDDSQRRNPLSSWRFLLFAVPVGALFNGLTIHTGETVLAQLPSNWPLIGGALTLEALLYGALNGLFLTVLLAAFGVFNRSVVVGDLIRYVPRAFYPLAIVVAIAISYVPNTLQQFRQVRDAQAIRGHRMKGIRDWLPLFLPVLIGGLERAFQLAESMTARGFAGNPRRESWFGPRWMLATTLGGLGAVLAGTVLRLSGLAGWSTILLAVGSVVIVAVIVLAGRQVKHTRLRRIPWQRQDWLSLIVLLGSLVTFYIFSAGTRAYSTFPALRLPGFDPISGVALFGLLVPLVVNDGE